MNFNLIIKYLSYRIRRPHRNGHGIHSPFLFDFVNQVVYKKPLNDQNLKDIQNLRKKLLKDKTVILVEDYGAGSSVISGNQRKISAIAKRSSSSHKYGKLLYNVVTRYKPGIIIELGSCLGLGSMYLAAGNRAGNVYTIEGSPNLFQKAHEHYDQLGFTNIEPEQGKFDDVLPKILSKNGKFDLAFIDGNHKKDVTLRYFNLLLPYVGSNSIIIFDDIRWSEEMQMSWLEICSNKNVTLSLDLFNLGVVFFNEKLIKQHFEIYY